MEINSIDSVDVDLFLQIGWFLSLKTQFWQLKYDQKKIMNLHSTFD